MGKMFGMMLPKGRNKLTLSQMHMAGMGTAMMKGLMKKKNVASLDEMFDVAGAARREDLRLRDVHGPHGIQEGRDDRLPRPRGLRRGHHARPREGIGDPVLHLDAEGGKQHMADYTIAKTLDYKGLACPMPIVKISQADRHRSPWAT